MDYSAISRLYRTVLDEEVNIYNVTSQQTRSAFRNMRDVYSPHQYDLSSSVVQILNFSDSAHRCAYLHRYAPLHTALTLDMFRLAVEENFELFRSFICKNTLFRICSLGSGPGCDVVGCISALHEFFGKFSISSTFVDIQDGWKKTLNSVFRELEYGNYALFSKAIRQKHIATTFLEYNLLQEQWNNDNVLQAVQSTELIILVKFISSAVSKDTALMIKKIFKACKPGSIILYIDNSVERYHHLLKNTARDCSLRTIYGPICHHLYERKEFDHSSFHGNYSCWRTRVTVHMWQKIATATPTVIVYAKNRETETIAMLDKDNAQNKRSSTRNRNSEASAQNKTRNRNSEASAQSKCNSTRNRNSEALADEFLHSEYTPTQVDCCCKLM